jgi:hypothetical protein
MASNSLNVATACMLWAFTFSKARDSNGNILEPDIRPESIHWNGIVSRPNAFPFQYQPRDGTVEEIVRATVQKNF